MIANLPSYPAYKPSGVDWLGDVPAYWDVLPNRSIFVEVDEQNHPSEQMLSVTITRGVLRQEELLKDKSKKDSSRLDRSAYKLVQPGDIAYNKMRAWQGAIGISQFRGIVSPAYIVQRPREELSPRFLHYLLRTPMFAKEAERWSYGIASDMWSLRPQHFKMIYACVPPLSEQRAIVRYLDHIDRRIQRYIEAKEKLISLLQEARQATIHRAVTRGLDPDVPLKPSGVEWLGDVPAHWEITRLKGNVANIAEQTNECGPEEIYIALENIERWTGRLRGVGRDESFDSHVKRFQVGDVLFGKLRPYLAKVTSPKRKGVCVSELLVLRCRGDSLGPRYLEQLMRSKPVIDTINASTFGAKMPRADWQFIGSMKHPLPSFAEQIAIAAHLDKATTNIDAAIATARRQCEFMQEYRTSLIAHVVTGKVDVRTAAAQLPQEAPEQETAVR